MTNFSIDALYSIVQSKQSSGSGRGVSYWSTAAICGRRARLKELHPEMDIDIDDGTALTPTGKRKANGRRCGTFYHFLQECWRTGQFPADVVIDGTECIDYDFELAVRSFKNYRAQFGDTPNNLGTVLGVEQKYPRDEADAKILTDLFGVEFSFRYDMLIEMDEETCSRIMVERGVTLPGPGKYLIDHKLVASISDKTYFDYTRGIQGLAYPVAYNAIHPDAPVLGMIFDVVARVAKPEAKHFQLFVAEASPDAVDIVRNALGIAKRNYDNDECNPIACNNGYGTCPFLKNGMCCQK